MPWPSRQFAMGVLFSYALGRPGEQIEIDDKREMLIALAKDPTLNEIAKRFGNGEFKTCESSCEEGLTTEE